MPPVKLTPTKRYAVRLSLITGSTLATIIGAQSLAALSQKTTAASNSALPAVVDPQQAPSDVTLLKGGATVPATPGGIAHAAPTIKIVRRPGTTGTTSQSAPAETTVIKPPSPVELSAPAPVIVQVPSAPVYAQAAAPAPAPAPQPVTRSSRR